MNHDIIDRMPTTIMLPKRRFGKDEQKMKSRFSTDFSMVRSPNRVLTPLKSASFENPDVIFCSAFPNLRLGVIKLISWCVIRNHKMIISWCCVVRIHKMMISWWCVVRNHKISTFAPHHAKELVPSRVEEFVLQSTIFTSLPLPNEGFGRRNKRWHPDFEGSTFQGREYSIWAKNHSRRQLVPFFSTISISNISTNISRWICGWHFCRNSRNGDCRKKGD